MYWGSMTVDSVLKGLSILITKLEKIRELNQQRATEKRQVVVILTEEANALSEEAIRAERVAGKIKALLE